MVPYNDHDFSQYSWLTACKGVAKLSVIFFVAILFLLFVLLALFGDMHEGDELHQDELRRWCNTYYPNLTFDKCVELEGL